MRARCRRRLRVRPSCRWRGRARRATVRRRDRRRGPRRPHRGEHPRAFRRRTRRPRTPTRRARGAPPAVTRRRTCEPVNPPTRRAARLHAARRSRCREVPVRAGATWTIPGRAARRRLRTPGWSRRRSRPCSPRQRRGDHGVGRRAGARRPWLRGIARRPRWPGRPRAASPDRESSIAPRRARPRRRSRHWA